MIRTDEQARRQWRTFGFWLLAHGVWAWPALILIISALGLSLAQNGIDGVVTQLVVAYGIHMAGFLGAAGVRQADKNNARQHGQDG
jgi:hypothetical protein